MPLTIALLSVLAALGTVVVERPRGAVTFTREADGSIVAVGTWGDADYVVCGRRPRIRSYTVYTFDARWPNCYMAKHYSEDESTGRRLMNVSSAPVR